jgi:hypothetical protein
MQRIVRGTIFLITFMCLTALWQVSSTVALGGIGGRPAHPDPANPRSSSIFIYTLNSGEEKQDQVLLSNSSNREQTIALYAVDATTTNTGSLACRQQVEARRDVGVWVVPATQEVTLASGGEKKISLAIKVPANATPGEHNGCLVFQQKNDAGESHGNIRIHTRQAVRIAITVPGRIHKQLAIERFTVATQQAQLFDITVRNNGNVSADTNVRVVLRDMFGQTLYQNGGTYPIFGGNRLALHFRNATAPFWGGIYTAQATIQYDKRPGVFSLSDKNQLLTLTSQRTYLFTMPAPPVLIATIVCIALVGLAIGWKIRQRRLIRHLQADAHHYTVQHGDTLETIAQAHDISWKKLAAANKLAPPYQLHAGQQLKTPGPSVKKRHRAKP